MAFSIDPDAVTAKSRLVHLTLLNLTLRIMENWRALRAHSGKLELDDESLSIMMAMIVIAAEPLLRGELEPELQCLSQQLPPSHLRTVNISSIAAATGINRETVRRKVGALQRAGWVLRDEEGIRPVQGVLPREALGYIMDAQLNTLVRMVQQLANLGVLTVER